VTAAELDAFAERLVASAVEQGFPEKVTDPGALAKVAAAISEGSE